MINGGGLRYEMIVFSGLRREKMMVMVMVISTKGVWRSSETTNIVVVVAPHCVDACGCGQMLLMYMIGDVDIRPPSMRVNLCGAFV